MVSLLPAKRDSADSAAITCLTWQKCTLALQLLAWLIGVQPVAYDDLVASESDSRTKPDCRLQAPLGSNGELVSFSQALPFSKHIWLCDKRLWQSQN